MSVLMVKVNIYKQCKTIRVSLRVFLVKRKWVRKVIENIVKCVSLSEKTWNDRKMSWKYFKMLWKKNYIEIFIYSFEKCFHGNNQSFEKLQKNQSLSLSKGKKVRIKPSYVIVPLANSNIVKIKTSFFFFFCGISLFKVFDLGFYQF